MKRTIFYSWQSDIENSENRNLIEDSLSRALKAINRDQNATIEPVLDRDTSGIPGSPSIAHSIFDKIALSDVFIADISIINKNSTTRLVPNPNVLVELGYAIGLLGWDRIILIQNTFYGSPDDLPFDLKGRRVITYTYKKDQHVKSEQRALLQGRLEAALRSALNDSTMMSLPASEHTPLWWGKWKMHDQELSHGGTLVIREVGAVGFLFDLNIFNGSHSGSITSYARIISPNLAYARIPNGDDGSFGELAFTRKANSIPRIIEIEETVSCSYHRGMGVTFNGKFIHRNELVFDRGFLNELELQRLSLLIGQYYDDFRSCMESMGETDNLDTFPAKVIWGGVRGLFTAMEGIVMVGDYGELWVAYIDNDHVRYFSTQIEWQDRLPITIDKWREKFREKDIIYLSPVNIVPVPTI
jgi:hypothetical protein